MEENIDKINETQKIIGSNKIKRKVRHALFIVSFTILPIVSFLLFYVYVNLDSFVMAFQLPERGTLEFVALKILSGFSRELKMVQQFRVRI